MISFRKLKTMKEFTEFAQNYKEACSGRTTPGVEVPPEKLAKKSLVMGAFENGEMVAGFVVNNTPDLAFEIMSDFNRDKMEKVAPLDQYYDLGGIWKKKGFSKKSFNSVVWPRIIFETIKFNPKKKRIVGYVLSGHGRAKSYDMTKPIYHQTVNDGINVFSMTRSGLFMGLVQGVLSDTIKGPKKAVKKPIRNVNRLIKHISLIR